ncbi:Gfo/Idh/MocA family protein [Haladaptatus halobius]|uniref:Gfo/Idh/MocA family protein n=1 Tax=Haladaptatus halobius TaxID=2884875 RepID=UPI001D0AFB6F|nr:Gfo/Idh/MocA family oxidoreductase [Haladaptatus halobius]
MAKNTDNQKVRLGFTGVGGRGAHLLERCLDMNDVDVLTVCDIQERHCQRAWKEVVESGRPEPKIYEDHGQMVKRDDLDGVVIATPWESHISMAITAMEADKFVGLEVGPANSVEECWELVRTAEETGSHCMLLENCCYYRDCMAVLNMVRQGIFGELVHCRCGYGHDLREPIITGSETALNQKDGRNYRGLHNEKRNGDLYPTHGIGPMAKCLNVNSGNRFVSLTSTASKSRGLDDWAENNLEPNHPSYNVDWSIGDIVTTVLKCANGETVIVNHDVSLPRPYSNMYHVQGTNGIWKRTFESIDHSEENPGLTLESSIYLEKKSSGHEWESFDTYQTNHDNPVWEEYLEMGRKAGHGGIDHLVLRDYVMSVKRGEHPPIDVYDAATWMVISPLSERSIALGNEPVAFPDFTNGAWMNNDPKFGLLGDDLPEHL